jgi:ADP-ribosyl-[dinitrogen reductase] hydrolase
VSSALGHAVRLSTDSDWRAHLPSLGQGWVAEEALAIAVLCALAADTPRNAIIAAVNHDGDSDSTGSITGNLVGAMHGVAALLCAFRAHVGLKRFRTTTVREYRPVRPIRQPIIVPNQQLEHNDA